MTIFVIVLVLLGAFFTSAVFLFGYGLGLRSSSLTYRLQIALKDEELGQQRVIIRGLKERCAQQKERV